MKICLWRKKESIYMLIAYNLWNKFCKYILKFKEGKGIYYFYSVINCLCHNFKKKHRKKKNIMYTFWTSRRNKTNVYTYLFSLKEEKKGDKNKLKNVKKNRLEK